MRKEVIGARRSCPSAPMTRARSASARDAGLHVIEGARGVAQLARAVLRRAGGPVAPPRGAGRALEVRQRTSDLTRDQKTRAEHGREGQQHEPGQRLSRIGARRTPPQLGLDPGGRLAERHGDREARALPARADANLPPAERGRHARGEGAGARVGCRVH